MAEFSVLAIPLLFLGLLTVEAGRWLVVRQAVSYALYEAARAGTLEFGSPAVMARALHRGLTPLLAGGQTDLDTAQAAVQQRLSGFHARHGLPALRVDIISPTRALFDDFADPGLPDPTGRSARVISNHYQQERHERDYRRRYRHGIGPRSGLDLFDANTLALRVIYLYMPTLPGLRAVMRALPASDADAYVRQARDAGALVIVRDISMPMQSHVVEWPQTSWWGAANAGK